jgi:hypothetical protein
MKSILANPGKGVALESFIKENEQLLTALGAFAALTVLFQGLPSNFFKYVLSFISLTGTILIWLEIFNKLPKQQAPRLWLFQYVLLWGGTSIVGYCIYTFRLIFNVFLFIPVSLLIFGWLFGTLSPIVRRLPLTRNIFGIDNPNKSKLQIYLKHIAVGVLVIISFSYGIYFSSGINLIFEVLNRSKI